MDELNALAKGLDIIFDDCKHEGTRDCEEPYFKCPCGTKLQFIPNGPDDPGEWEIIK